MQHVFAQRRLTHKYSPGWAYLDKHGPGTSLRLTPWRRTEPAQEYDDNGAFVAFTRIPAGLSRAQREELKDALRDTLGGSSCQHEHDCCGCAIRTVYVTSKGRRFRVEMRVYYNY